MLTSTTQVALVIDGKLEFAIEEERLNRVKTSLGLFPERGIKAALNQSGLSLQDIDSIAIDGVTSKHLEAKLDVIFIQCSDIAQRLRRYHILSLMVQEHSTQVHSMKPWSLVSMARVMVFLYLYI